MSTSPPVGGGPPRSDARVCSVSWNCWRCSCPRCRHPMAGPRRGRGVTGGHQGVDHRDHHRPGRPDLRRYQPAWSAAAPPRRREVCAAGCGGYHPQPVPGSVQVRELTRKTLRYMINRDELGIGGRGLQRAGRSWVGAVNHANLMHQCGGLTGSGRAATPGRNRRFSVRFRVARFLNLPPSRRLSGRGLRPGRRTGRTFVQARLCAL